MAQGSGPRTREGASALLIDADGRLLMQLRDDLPHVSDRGKISLFGGRREGSESFPECVVREVHDETGLYLTPDRFELIGRYSGPNYAMPDDMPRGEFYLVRDVPADKLAATEGKLRVVTLDELEHIQELLAPPTKYALAIFLKRQPPI